MLWFEAVFLVAQTRCGISAKQLERHIGVTYKTAHRMMKLIRSQMDDDALMLAGEVESDETYFNRTQRLGSNPLHKPGRRPGARVVWGAVERHGRVIAKHVPDATVRALGGNVISHVLPSSTVFTDEHRSYGGLEKAGYEHLRISHSANVYVAGNVHTQTIEGFWSLLKRGIGGVYHAVSTTYLQSYLDEYSFRCNHRQQERPMFWLLLERVVDPDPA